MRRLILSALLLFCFVSSASADAYFDLTPGPVTSLSQIGVGFYAEPVFSGEPIFRVGPGVDMLLRECSDTGWALVCLPLNDSLHEGYVRSASLVMNDYGLGWDVVRIVAPEHSKTVPFYRVPSEDAEVHGYYFTGVLMNLYEVQSDGFCRVAMGETVGYIPSGCLFAWDSCEDSELPAAVIASTSGEGAMLENAAGSGATVPTAYPDGTEVAVLGIHPDGRCHVIIDGHTGFLQQHELQPVLTAAFPEAPR